MEIMCTVIAVPGVRIPFSPPNAPLDFSREFLFFLQVMAMKHFLLYYYQIKRFKQMSNVKEFYARIVLILFFLLTLSLCTVHAAETISFEAEAVTAQNGRKVTVDMLAQCDKKLSAASFVFDYDSSVLEFQGISAPGGTQTVFSEKGSTVRVSYLNIDGADISAKAAIFSLEFKAVSAGSSEISYSVNDCVADDAQIISIGSCLSGQVTVSAAADKTQTENRNKKPTEPAAPATGQKATEPQKQKSEAETKAPKAAKTEKTTFVTSPTINDTGTIDSVSQNAADRVTPVIVLCTCAAVAAAFIGYIIYLILGKNKKNSSDE